MDLFSLAQPVLRQLDPEQAHHLTLWALKRGLGPSPDRSSDAALAIRLWGREFPNPIGLAAGFDKNAEVPDSMLRLGFGFVEIGTVTPRTQPGQARPRVFRLNEDGAVINRLGFPSAGVVRVAARLAERPRGPGLLGANVGANHDSPDFAADYVKGLTALHGLADYFVINVSSPNTPGLRDLQAKEALDELLGRVQGAREAPPPGAPAPAPLLVKISPDLDDAELEAIAEVTLARGIEGLIISNTTAAQPDHLRSRYRAEAGGLSGAPLFEQSTDLLRRMHRLTARRVTLVGTGGIASGRDAYEKIRAGASLVQLYTALAFHGPGLVERIKRDLAALLVADGFAHIADAVGVDVA